MGQPTKKPRILFVTNELDASGGSVFSIKLVEKLVEKGNELVVVAEEGILQDRMEALTGKVYYLPLTTKNPWTIRASARRIFEILEREGCDLLFCDGITPAIAGYLVSRRDYKRLAAEGKAEAEKERVKVVSISHGLWRNWYYLFCGRLFEHLCDCVITVCEFERQRLIRRGVRPGKVVTIHNGYPAKEIPSRGPEGGVIRREFGIAPSVKIVGFVGRLSPEKGPLYLLRSFPEVLRSLTETKLLIVGDGILKEKLLKTAADLGCEKNVLFTGYRDDVEEILADVDVLINPSLWDLLPMIILQAMMMEVPVVASRVGGIPELVDEGVTGLLVPSRDEQALAGAIVALLGDRGKAREMGWAGRRRVLEEFNIDDKIREFEDLFRSFT
jgi:glycosyltransferase involved in cell wall biosynthesis